MQRQEINLMPNFCGTGVAHCFGWIFVLIDATIHSRSYWYSSMAEDKSSSAAGEFISRIYHTLLTHCPQAPDQVTLQVLNRFCVRLVFCLYAGDAGLFAENQFLNYLRRADSPEEKRMLLSELFRVLDLPKEQRDTSDATLLALPHIHGGLFSGVNESSVPPLNRDLFTLIENEVAAGFNWCSISPSVFGGLFESTLTAGTRRSGGMHYTSVDNIHKVIDPLFLDDLKDELTGISADNRVPGTVRIKRLRKFCKKLASLTFLDPACGSGNFLTETYISLCRLENEALRHIAADPCTPCNEILRVQVTYRQFHGIEINDFAAAVAGASLQIAAAEMRQETREFSTCEFRHFSPPEGNIRVGNALALDWLDTLPDHRVDFIIGNPPFSGARIMSKEQKDDLTRVFAGAQSAGNLDYVTCWFLRAAQLMQANPSTRTAFVATSSIVQGQSVALLWRPLMEFYGMFIEFAYRSFKWTGVAAGQAEVHCVIIGMTARKPSKCTIYDERGKSHPAVRINGYLSDTPCVFIEKRTHPLCDVPEMVFGNSPIDGGYFLFTPKEKDEFLAKEPNAAKYFRYYVGGKELIRGRVRYCLWLADASPREIANMPCVAERVRCVREYRIKSNRKKTRENAERAWLFSEIRQPDKAYLAIPSVSSEKRMCLPMAFFEKDVITCAGTLVIPGATLYHFGVLTSAMHTAWIRAVAGYLGYSISYSASIVYNNFPWPIPSISQRSQIESAAQAILSTREQYPNSTLATLYDPHRMPSDLQRAHRNLDSAVDAAYGRSFPDAHSRVIHLSTLYRCRTTDPPYSCYAINDGD